MSFELGAAVPLSVTIKDKDNNLANAGAVALTVTLPDGTTAVTTGITPTSTGVYDHDFPTTQAGVHQVRWVATGLNASAFTDVFTVDAAAGRTFISLAEIKRHLKKDLTETKDDAELLEFIASACQMIEDRIGPVSPRSATQTVWRHAYLHASRQILLDQHPVIGVTTVTVDGTTVPEADPVAGADGWVLDAAPGVLAHTRHWPWGRVQVTYRVGRSPLPGNIQMAGLELAGHFWRTMKLTNSGNGRPNPAGADDLALRGVGYALPYRVRELLGLGKLPTSDVQVG
jgi:hypothetical protein